MDTETLDELSKNVSIIVGEKEIKVQRWVLTICSDVLKLKLAHSYQVIVTDFEYEIVEACIKEIYDSRLNNLLSFEQKLKMLHFFDKHGITEKKDGLESYLITLINELNISKLYKAAQLSNAENLLKRCKRELPTLLADHKKVADLDILDKDILAEMILEAYCPVSNTKIVSAPSRRR